MSFIIYLVPLIILKNIPKTKLLKKIIIFIGTYYHVKNFLFKGGRNILILEKSNKSDKSKINLLCPKYLNEGNYFDVNKETIILIKIDEYFEPLISVYFRKMSVHDVTHRINTSFDFNESSKDMKDLFNLFIKKCRIKSKTNKILDINELEYKLSFIQNKNYKIKTC